MVIWRWMKLLVSQMDSLPFQQMVSVYLFIKEVSFIFCAKQPKPPKISHPNHAHIVLVMSMEAASTTNI